MKKGKVFIWVPILLLIIYMADLAWLFRLSVFRLYSITASTLFLFALFFFLNKSGVALIFKVSIIIMTLTGLVNNQFSYLFFVRLIQDLGIFGLITSVFFISQIFAENALKLLKIIIFISLPIFLYTISLVNISLIVQGGEFNRDLAFLDIYSQGLPIIVYWTQNIIIDVFLILLLLLPFFTKKLSKQAVVSVVFILAACVFIFAAYYQKRQAFIELLFVVVVFFTFYKNLVRGFVPSSYFISFVGLILVIWFLSESSLTMNIIHRFLDSAKDIKHFDRIEESRYYLSRITLIDLILGKGLGSYVPNTPGGTILHIGYINLIFKGGIILLLFYLFNIFYNMIYCLRKLKTNPLYIVGFSFSLFLFMQLFYSPAYSWNVVTISTGLGLFSRFFIDDYLRIQSNPRYIQ